MHHARATASMVAMNIPELTRRVENLLRLGTVAEVDHPAARCRVKTGGLLTDWLPWFTRRAGSTNDWDPPSVGEQCLVLSPSGDPAVGFVLVGVYSQANPADSDDPAVHRTEWANGDHRQHHADSGEYRLHVSGHVQIDAASLTIDCSGPVVINGSTIDLN